MPKTTYSFKVHINSYERVPYKQDLRYIDVSGVTLVTKNAKFGMLGFATVVKRRQGQFLRVCGSCQYPELVPLPRGVTLTVRKFPTYPRLFKHDLVEDGTVTITDLKEHVVYEGEHLDSLGLDYKH